MAWRGLLSKSMNELRIQVCQTSAGSAGAREFVFQSYPELKKLNPTLPILVREAAGTEAKLWARFDFGVEKSVKVEGMSKAEVAAQVEGLVKMGETMPKAA
eukprot:CAMPEP_0117677426 /NCGR_PEP_ID=MMETSP0804-20121206/16738_1 /TAXON_ID=1074897 /ORGANISM="Tetraselmis astigmatica, Strain CCMP880" /LENGTH=100 /DNA_ID=CAMNT_0005486707 /DNA_START=77 /DNA_END=379 /DNA_ORIENTATION=+